MEKTTARKHFSKMIDKDVTECRFFVGKDDYCYLGASPDGLIDDDGLVESKCPYKGKDSTPETINFATFVNGKFKPEVDLYEQFRKCGVFEEFNKVVARVANNASSLLHDVDNNLTEHFNSILNKFLGEKRINFSLSGSYETRCFAAALEFNKKSFTSSVERYFNKSGKLGKYTSSHCDKKIVRIPKRRRTRNKTLHSGITEAMFFFGRTGQTRFRFCRGKYRTTSKSVMDEGKISSSDCKLLWTSVQNETYNFY